MSETWTNWSGGLSFSPSRIARPVSEAEIAAIVAGADASSQTVRVAGTGHSSMPLVATDGVLMSLDGWQGVESFDPARRRAVVRAGTKLHALGPLLHARGLGMENLGDVDVQAVGGAVGTGTHGTGPSMGNISSRVRGARLVAGDGSLVDIGEGDERLRAVRVALGALGILVSVDLELLPAYRLEERTWREAAEECLARLDERIAATRHFEFFWFPQGDFSELKSLHPTADAVDDFGEGGRRCGWSHEIIPSVRELKFHEMEYAVPAEAGPECFVAVRSRMQSHHPDVAWPIEYRTLHADDAYLSPAHGRATVTISVHQDGRRPYREFFEDIEPIFRAHAGRPHWGKVHTCSPAELRALYPQWDEFCAVREHLDPPGTFLNAYLRSLFRQ